LTPKYSKNSETNTNGFADTQVIAAIQNDATGDPLALKWFFEDVKHYSLGVWRKKYRDISDEAWNDIFTDSTIKLITRVKKGLTLKEGTRLKSYFTTVVEYSVLDHFAKKKKDKTLPLISNQRIDSSIDTYAFEEAQIANLIKEKLQEITENTEQVKVILLFAKGYKYKEIVEKTTYKSEGACRNAYLKGKKKIVSYILQYPDEGVALRQMLIRASK